jgi:hypothetical protein
MSRFAAQRPDEVCEFLTTQLPPENSISVFCTVGSRVLHRDKNRDAAEKIFRRAVAQLPGVKDPHIQVISLIRAGLNELDPEQSIELYDKYNPNPSDYPFAVGSLIHLGMPVLIERAEAVARRQGKSPEEILPEIIARAATEKRETVFAWLTERPADQLRENCLPSVVEAWRHYMIANLREESRSWLEPLWNVAVVVRDDELKWRAFHELLKLSRALDVAPPQPHFDEARRLFESLNVAETFTLRDWSGEITLGLLTPDGERRWIATFLPEVLEDASLTPEHLAESRGRLAGLARIVARSSLPVDEKRALFRRLISYSGDNRSVKAHLAQPLAEFNCRGALELLWSTLPADRGASGKKVYLDWIPPPSDAHDAIAWLRHDEYSRESPDNAVAAALWEFLPEAPAGDRDALLAEMSATLIRLGRHEEAHGVARIINSPSERAIALAKIAGAAGGK